MSIFSNYLDLLRFIFPGKVFSDFFFLCLFAFGGFEFFTDLVNGIPCIVSTTVDNLLDSLYISKEVKVKLMILTFLYRVLLLSEIAELVIDGVYDDRCSRFERLL